MTFQIKKSDLLWSEEDFDVLVRQHADALAEYNCHLIGVEQDAANPDLKPEDRRVAFPPPTAHPLIEGAINGYQIVGPSLAERKEALTVEIRQREQALLEKIIPPGKQRHWNFREQDIRAQDQLSLTNNPVRFKTTDEVDTWLRANRPADETAFLDDIRVRRDSVAVIQRWAAKIEHDIDDLTEETVDAFEMPVFNG